MVNSFENKLLTICTTSAKTTPSCDHYKYTYCTLFILQLNNSHIMFVTSSYHIVSPDVIVSGMINYYIILQRI